MNRLLPAGLVLCLVFSCSTFAATIDPLLEKQLALAEADDPVPVLIRFHGRTDLSRYSEGRHTAGPMIRALQEMASAEQAGVLERLSELGLAGEATRLWANNSLALSAPRRVVEELARRPEVRLIEADREVVVPSTGDGASPAPGSVWNIDLVGVDRVWDEYGLDGSGIVIGYIDYGFEPDHPSLAGKWRGGDNSWFDAVNGQTDPYDDQGHGTRVVGVLVGGDGPGPETPDIGLAYGAEFIAAKAMDIDTAVLSDIEECGQWMLDPDGNPNTDDFPDVVSNSWGADQNYTGFRSILEAWHAAGMIPIFAIGNGGPGPSTTLSPGNNDITIGAGAVGPTDELWVSSSRGPTPAGPHWPADRIKPDIIAPGHQIYSCTIGGGFNTQSGTSYATPHVAGTVALMLQGNPGLTYEEIRGILISTAQDKGAPGKENNHGWGRLDSYAAVTMAIGDGPIVTGPGRGPDNPTTVRVFDASATAAPLAEWGAYGVDAYGVNVATGDLDGDTVVEVLTGAGPGAVFGPHVRGFQLSGGVIPAVNFLAYGTPRWGVNVAAGDLDADGFDEIITGAGPGAVFGPHVRGWDWDGIGSVDPIAGISYFAYGTPKWGVNVAAGDIDGDGFDEIVTGAGPGAVYGPHVRGWNWDGSGTAAAIPGVSFLAYGTNKFGVNVACGDIDGDGYDEIVTGAGPGAVFGPHVRGWNWDGSGSVVPIPAISFFAYHGHTQWGVNVGTGDVDGDGIAELLTGPGPDESHEARVRAFNYDGGTLTPIGDVDFLAFDPATVSHGVKVTGGRP